MKVTLFYSVLSFLLFFAFLGTGACECKTDKKADIDSLRALEISLKAKLDSVRVEISKLEAEEIDAPPDEKLIDIKVIRQ
ncbi:hypothetical protein JW998_12650 [candidate division KSB1 bacterium]|nr:hypothetical protein [candidate division KSB1 bacterium]